jgi:RNA polymerase sigma factor (sigma-70 family)
MERPHELVLLDRDGKPLDTRIARVLASLRRRLRRQFPQLRDEVTITEVLERAGGRLASRERRAGPIEKLNGYAWVTLRNVARSEMRRGSARLIQNTLESGAGDAHLASTPAAFGTPADIERSVLLRELLGTLSQEERQVCDWKRAGVSSQEIAQYQGRSVSAVDTLYSRAKQKLRHAVGTSQDNRRLVIQDGTETDHGTTRSASRQ